MIDDMASRAHSPWLVGAIVRLGRYAVSSLTMTSRVGALLVGTLAILIRGGPDGQRVSLNSVLNRVVDMGPQALGLTLRFGISIGLVIGILLESWLDWGDLLEFAIDKTTVLMVEQVAPLFVAIMVAAHSGGALAADLGIMVATHEIDALRSLGLCPERLLVAPSILGALVAVPLLTLTMIFCIILMFAFYLNLTGLGSIALIVTLAFSAMEPTTIGTAMGKAALFGPLIAAIAAAHGLVVQPTTRLVGSGVSRATVTMISSILLTNALLTLAF